MKLTRGFEQADRYKWDLEYSAAKGWAQVDTEQDAPYFGMWANPFEMKIFEYCEGDTALFEFEAPEEFAAHLRETDAFEIRSGRRPVKIDGMCNDRIIKAFESLNLTDMLH